MLGRIFPERKALETAKRCLDYLRKVAKPPEQVEKYSKSYAAMEVMGVLYMVMNGDPSMSRIFDEEEFYDLFVDAMIKDAEKHG